LAQHCVPRLRAASSIAALMLLMRTAWLLASLAVAVATAEDSALDAAMGRELRGGGGGRASINTGNNANRPRMPGGKYLILTGCLSGILILSGLVCMCCRYEAQKRQERKERATQCLQQQHVPVQMSCAEMVERDSSYARSWICNLCQQKHGPKKPFKRCDRCHADFCDSCLQTLVKAPDALQACIEAPAAFCV